MKNKGALKHLNTFITDNADSEIDNDDSDAAVELEGILWNLIDLSHTEKIACEIEEPPMSFMTTTSAISNSKSAFIYHDRKAVTVHAWTAKVNHRKVYGEIKLYGIMIDSGCARGVTSGIYNYMAYFE